MPPEETKNPQERPRPQKLAVGMQNTANLFRPLNEIIESATLRINEDDDDEEDSSNSLIARMMQHAGK